MPVHYTPDYYDHQRDLRKHEPRPTDPITALNVCLLVRGLNDPMKGAELIEQYARTAAAAARLEGVQQAYNRVDAALSDEKRP